MMDLAGIASRAGDVAFDVAGQITRSVSYVRVGGAAEPEYEAEAGTVNEHAVTIAKVTAMILPFRAKEIDGDKVRTGDEKVVIRRSQLGALSEPDLSDYLTETANPALRRDVINFTADATRTFWILHCRRYVG